MHTMSILFHFFEMCVYMSVFVCLFVCVCVHVCVCVRACVHVCVRACVRACMRVCVQTKCVLLLVRYDMYSSRTFLLKLIFRFYIMVWGSYSEKPRGAKFSYPFIPILMTSQRRLNICYCFF
jgi:hypothetical protein